MHDVSSSPSSHILHPNFKSSSTTPPPHEPDRETDYTFLFSKGGWTPHSGSSQDGCKIKNHPSSTSSFCLSPHLHRLLPRSLGDLITQRGFQLRTFTSHHITSVCSNRTYDPIHFPNIAESRMLLVPSRFQFFSLFFCSLFRALWWSNGGARVCNTQMADECGIARCVCEQLSGGGIRVCDVR